MSNEEAVGETCAFQRTRKTRKCFKCFLCAAQVQRCQCRTHLSVETLLQSFRQLSEDPFRVMRVWGPKRIQIIPFKSTLRPWQPCSGRPVFASKTRLIPDHYSMHYYYEY